MIFEDILKNSERLKDINFATDIYRALCNQVFYNYKEDELINYSWRAAGGLVAEVRNFLMPNNQEEDYLDFYCSGNEGNITEEVDDFFQKNHIITFEEFYDETSKPMNEKQFQKKVEKFIQSHPIIIAYKRDNNLDLILNHKI